MMVHRIACEATLFGDGPAWGRGPHAREEGRGWGPDRVCKD